MTLSETNSSAKTQPLLGAINERYLLNKEGSTKKTYHVALCVKGLGLTFKPGDAIGIYPENPVEEVEEILSLLQATGDEEVIPKRQIEPKNFRDYLISDANLSRVAKILNPEGLDLPLLDFLRATKSSFSAQEIATHLGPMLPRFYSIASSMNHSPDEIHLTVATFSKWVGEREIPGLGSDFLARGAEIGKRQIRLFLQPNPRFGPPSDAATPIIMIGPGTGVAPFRAFMQERSLLKTRNWLFFGERHSRSDFYYQDEFQKWQSTGKLRLSTAFSRDRDVKTYVQHRLLEERDEVLSWIKEGAHIYICGDAKEMAKDVLAAIDHIVEGVGETAKSLRGQKRLFLDVY